MTKETVRKSKPHFTSHKLGSGNRLIRNKLIKDKTQIPCIFDHPPTYSVENIKRSLELSVTALILIHNHSIGDPQPSTVNIDMTNSTTAATQPFNIVIKSHTIVTRGDSTSLRNESII